MRRSELSCALLACLVLIVGPLGACWAAPGDTLRIGSKRFTESYVLAEILKGAAAPHAEAVHLQGLGNTAILFEALKQGSIDLYPDYTGTIAAEILKLASADSDIATIGAQLARSGLGIAVPFGFNNTYAIAVPADAVATRSLSRLSDLKTSAALRIGLSHEFIGRADGWPGLAARYGLPQKPTALDHGLAYEALAAGQVDAIDAYSTDAKIGKYRLRVLTDDLAYFPRYDAVVLYRLDVPGRFPAAWQAITQLQGRIDEARMIALNGAVEIDGQSFASVAARFLGGAGPVTTGRSGLWAKLAGDDFWRLTLQHAQLVLVSVGLAMLVGIPLGVVAAFNARLGAVVLAMTAAFQTIPSLALLAMLIPVFGTIGTAPALFALFLYALLPIVRNTCVGLRQIPEGLKQAASAIGLSARDRLMRIELPLAMPVILAGVKTAAVMSVGTATIAAFIGAGGYGERISIGLALNDHQMLLAGALPAAGLAIVTQALFEIAERMYLPPHGRR